MQNHPIRVLIVDDSLLIRTILSDLLKEESGIEVVGTAQDPLDAREKIKQLNPDVVTLDVEMPKMDGISFLEKIMTLRPMPVVMISTLTQKGAETTIRALELGAVDCIAKPLKSEEDAMRVMKEEIVSKIRLASTARVGAGRAAPTPSGAMRGTQERAAILDFNGNSHVDLIAIGSSTGGVEALRDVLQLLPATLPPIVITQHMPEMFTQSFANRLNQLCQLEVSEGREGQRLERGHAYIAPGGRHFDVKQAAGIFRSHVRDGELVSGHRPSVDVLFHSVAKNAGARAIGVILTGMGSDGADGLLAMRQAGAATLGQNQASCVVYGMPRAAMQRGAVAKELPLREIAGEIIRLCGTHLQKEKRA